MKKIRSLYAVVVIILLSFTTPASAQAIKPDTSILITQVWKMPAILREISGITWIDEHRLACIQDEKGTIFIYNLTYDSIEKEIPFAGSGDFEGIALVGKTLYAIRSNGILYSIKNYNSAKPIVTEIKTWLSKQNIEGLCYDRKHNRLLIAIKGSDPVGKNYKGIYAYTLRNGKLNSNPVLKINFTDTAWHEAEHKMQPSDLAINPLTGEIYVIDGETPSILVMSATGKHKKVYYLDTGDFKLPEGISFSKTGQLFICNEGRLLGHGNIVEFVINDR